MNLVHRALKPYLSLMSDQKKGKRWFYSIIFLLALMGPIAHAGGGGEHAKIFAQTFLWMAILLILAKISNLVQRWGQPAVLGELVMGVILGNLALIGIHVFDPISHNQIITFLAELGVVILLFQIGLESNIKEMTKTGMRSLMVAIVGVVLPFVLGAYIVGPWLLPGMANTAYIFLGASLTATSVGITARVFKDLGKLKSSDAQIVLGAAVIDDILGLIILAVVEGIAKHGSVSGGDVGIIIAKAIVFLVGSIVLGQLFAPRISKIFAKIQTGVGMKFTLVISFALVFSFLASYIGLAPIIGAFAAGLILDAVHFKYFKDAHVIRDIEKAIKNESKDLQKKICTVLKPHSDRHIEDIIEPISYLLVPLFFLYTGFQVDLSTLFDTQIILVALAISVAAILGKIACGFFAGKGHNKWLIGWAMVPRGEVGLIFAALGKGIGAINDELFSVIVIMVIITTLIAPPVLSHIIKKGEKKA